MRRPFVAILAFGIGASCSGSSTISEASGSTTGNPSTQSSTTTESQGCDWPSAADTFNADAGAGCKPGPGFESCVVPNGSIILGDGGVVTPDGGVVMCTDLCSPTEYSLSCSGAFSAENAGAVQIPAPASSLGCSILPLPTPINELFYCCPCAP
jgi:hypothetical protein